MKHCYDETNQKGTTGAFIVKHLAQARGVDVFGVNFKFLVNNWMLTVGGKLNRYSVTVQCEREKTSSRALQHTQLFCLKGATLLLTASLMHDSI